MVTTKAILLSSLIILFMGCNGLDDSALPKDILTHIDFQNFEVNPERNYVRGRLINNSSYVITSCRFRVNIYPKTRHSVAPLKLTEAELGAVIPLGKTPALSEDFFVREPLKPGYSTEVYFELRLNELSGPAVFTREIIELKGRVSH